MSGTSRRTSSVRSLELYRSCVDAATNDVSEAVVTGAYNNTLRALMHLLNFADSWYKAQNEAGTVDDNGANANLKVDDERTSLSIHLLLTRRVCDLTGKLIALNVQRRLTTRDSILNKVLANRKISDTSAALLFRLENVTAAFTGAGTSAVTAVVRPDGFPDGTPDSLSFIDTSGGGGYAELIGVGDQVDGLQRRIQACRVAKTSTLVLLYGPPGTGKTSLIVAAAIENSLPVVTVTASNLGGEFIGERDQNTADMFDYLESVKTDYVLFVDEADSFLPEFYENNTQSRLTRVLTINRTLRLVARNDGFTRIVALASNYDDRIARDVAESSFKLYLAAPTTEMQMRDLVSFYRKRANLNMTRLQSDYVVRTALHLGYAPGHVSLLVRRLLTNALIKMLNNRTNLQELSVDLLEEPVYMIEQGERFADGRTSVTVVRLSDAPRTERDDVIAAAWERGGPIAFPVPDLNAVDFESVLSGRGAGGVRTYTSPPTVESELGPFDFDDRPAGGQDTAVGGTQNGTAAVDAAATVTPPPRKIPFTSRPVDLRMESDDMFLDWLQHMPDPLELTSADIDVMEITRLLEQ